jgi:predicted DNA binding protein
VWTENVETIVHAYLQAGATILEAIGQHPEWELRMRFDDHQKAGEFHRYCEENDIAYELNWLYDPSESNEASQFELTSKQREALEAARRAGFYDVPPGATMTDVARTVGISQQALSKRLRRAHGSLVDAVLSVEEPRFGEGREGI